MGKLIVCFRCTFWRTGVAEVSFTVSDSGWQSPPSLPDALMNFNLLPVITYK